MTAIKPVTIGEVELVAHRLAKELMRFNEPIPDFSTRFPNILESCLLAPFQTFSQKPFYKGLLGKTAILFYLMVKNHPFKNGNKRVAMTTLFYFLHRNGKWLKVDARELYRFAMWVAESLPESREAVVQDIERFLGSHLEDLK